MNVAFVNSTHRWGGVKSWTLRVAEGLRDQDHGVVLFLRPEDPFREACRERGLEARSVRFGPDWNPLAVRTVHDDLRSHKTDVVVTNVSKDNRIAGPACRALSIPVLMRVGRSGDITNRWRLRLDQRHFVSRVVVPAHAIRDHLAHFPWMDAGNRVTVIPNGVDTDRYRPGKGEGVLRRELELVPEVPIVVTTCQLTSIKGLDVLLDAFARVATRPLPVLALIGRGSEEDALRERSRSLGISDRVRFLGFRRNLEELLDDATVAVQPSHEEGLPNSVVEFMAMGKAILATRLPGVEEAVRHETHAVLVPPGEVETMSGALSGLLQNPGLRERLGAAARQRAVAEFRESVMVSRVVDLLESMRTSRDP